MKRTLQIARFFLFPALVCLAWPQQQELSSLNRGRAMDILHVVGNEVKKHYYDPKFHGVDWDAKVSEAKKKIETATSFNMAISHIAAALDTLNDSHTFLLPPQHAYVHDYGLRYQIVGERCFVTQVRPGRDADTKGVKPGDEILTINGFDVNRTDLWRIQYVFGALRPQLSLRFTLRDPAGVTRQVEVAAKIREKKRITDLTLSDGASDIWDLVRQSETQEHLLRARYLDAGDDLIVLKVPEFSFNAVEVENMIAKTNKHQNLIIDLRGNPGGSVETLRYLVGGVFDRQVKIADRVGRKENKPEVAKPSRHPFTGKLVVLVDAQSASAAEVFARLVQLEKRGIVIGDHTSGSVMEAARVDEKMGADTLIFYGISITEADLIMSDGKSLEHVGVAPDETVVPTAQDLASGSDPVLAYAAQKFGVKLTPEQAGKAYPYEWDPEE